MQEWIRTMYLMARARVLSPERDSPYLGFVCRCWVETLTMTPSFATLLSSGLCFDLFLLRFQEYLMLDSPFCIPMVVKLDLLSNADAFH